LRILRDADLVEDQREGKWIVYRIPENSRKNLELLLNQFLKEEVKESEEIAKDLRNIEVCLKEQVRKRNSPAGQRLER
jgi:DNA-binding transcriptional ArsR family regulator